MALLMGENLGPGVAYASASPCPALDHVSFSKSL